MGEILEGLKKYYKNTSNEELKRKQEKSEFLNNIGPDALEYIRKVKQQYINNKDK